MKARNLVILLLSVTVIAPIAFFNFPSSAKQEFILSDVTVSVNQISQEETNTKTLKDLPNGVSLSENSASNINNIKDPSQEGLHLGDSKREHHASGRVLSATNEEHDNNKNNNNPIIREVTDTDGADKDAASTRLHLHDAATTAEDAIEKDTSAKEIAQHSDQASIAAVKNEPVVESKKRFDQVAPSDARIRQLKDQLIRAKVYLSLPATRNNPHLTRELRLRMKEVQRALGSATRDSELPKNAYDKLKAMEQTLAKGKQVQDDCASVVKKLRAMLHSSEDQLRVHKKQTVFLTQLTAKTIPKGLHCLPLRLTTEYYSLNYSQKQFPNQEKLEDPRLYHYALFSDNILAAAVVVNSTITNAKDPSNHVFHIVTDKLNYAAMRMWFHMNPPGKATVQVQSVEEFTWLNSTYSPVLQQLASQSMIDYYFRAHRANSDSNLKFRNPKYLSILNHLRFYLPEIFPKLNKVLFLDDDIVVQKDLTGLWTLDLKGNVNGAVETCKESFHRFDRYLNFSNPLIAKNFDPHACGWAYGMNIFDLEQWKRQNITEVYHKWQRLNEDRQLWKLGTLPPGLITFWKRTYALDKSWHVLGLGYNPSVNQRDIERAAVIHYNGNMKPWLEIGIPKYRNYWAKYVDYDTLYLRECNINP